jgi:hypothetical protein
MFETLFILLVIFLVGFGSGYGLRAYVSRQRRKRVPGQGSSWPPPALFPLSKSAGVQPEAQHAGAEQGGLADKQR